MTSISGVSDYTTKYGIQMAIAFLTYTYIAVLRIRDVYPGSWFFSIPSRIPDQKPQKRVAEKKFLTFFCIQKFHKILIYDTLFLNRYRTQFVPIDIESKYALPHNCNKGSQNYGFGIIIMAFRIMGSGSESLDPENTYHGSGSRGPKKASGSGSPTLKHITQHLF